MTARTLEEPLGPAGVVTNRIGALKLLCGLHRRGWPRLCRAMQLRMPPNRSRRLPGPNSAGGIVVSGLSVESHFASRP